MNHGQRVEDALTALATALEAGDPINAADAGAHLDAVCREVTVAGVQLEAPVLQRALKLLLRCELEAGRVQESIRASILQSGNSRRATDAYRPR